MEFNGILSIEPVPHKPCFWIRFSSGFRIEMDAITVFMNWGRKVFEKFKLSNELSR